MRNALQQLQRSRYVPHAGRQKRIDPAWAGANLQDLGGLAGAHPNFAALGAIGPDLFFFLPDFRKEDGIPVSSVLKQVLSFLEWLYGTLDPYVSKYEKYLGPLAEDNSELISRVTGGLSDTVGDITGELGSILFTALEDFVTKQEDWFGLFSLGLNHGWDEQAYYWSDMLHYRGTGRFGDALWRRADAQNDDQLRAYALGYITHLATDVTGHAYVNAIAGGPYRQHWQRHHLVENHCDAFWYLGDGAAGAPRNVSGYDQLTESALYYDIAFANDGSAITRPSFPGGHTLRDNWTRRRLLDQDSSMPGSIVDLLTAAMKDVFYTGAIEHPAILSGDGRPSSDQVSQAYDLMYRFFKFTMVDGFSHEPPDPPPVFGNLDFPTATDPQNDSSPADGGGGGGGGGSFWDDLLDFILAVANAIGYALEVVAWFLTLPIALITDVLNYPLRYLLYWALEMPLYHMLKDFRAVLVLTGYMVPMEDEIASSLVQIGTTSAESFDRVKAEMGDVFGAWLAPPPAAGTQSFNDPHYPLLDSNSKATSDLEYHHPWAYPQTSPELPLTIVGPYAKGAEPSVLFVPSDTDAQLRDGYETAADAPATDAVSTELTPERHLGDPVAFSKYLVWLATRSPKLYDQGTIAVTDWNLDSDRGYGYKCWDWNRHTEPGQTTNDPEGNAFANPCVWPTQADEGTIPPSGPLQIHYVPGADPGCAPEPVPVRGPR